MVNPWRYLRPRSGVVCATFVVLDGTAVAGSGYPPNGVRTHRPEPTGHAAVYCAPVYWRSARDGDQRCPRTHGLISDVGLIHLRWTKWSDREATGDGLSAHRVVLSCQLRPPYHCRTKIDQSGPIGIRLTRTVQCADGRRIYSRIQLVSYAAKPCAMPTMRHDRRRPPRGRWSYYCRPWVPTRDLWNSWADRAQEVGEPTWPKSTIRRTFATARSAYLHAAGGTRTPGEEFSAPDVLGFDPLHLS